MVLFAAAVVAGVTYCSLFYASPYVRTWDEVDFTLACLVEFVHRKGMFLWLVDILKRERN